MTEINNCHPTIKLTSESSDISINYLDLTISIQENHLETTTYFKPTNTFSYFPGNSHHPTNTKEGIFKGEIIRILRNNSNQQQYHLQSNLLKEKFKDRNYHIDIITQELPTFEEREDYLTKDNTFYITFITNYDPTLKTPSIIRENWPLLLSEENLRKKLINGPRICYRSPPT